MSRVKMLLDVVEDLTALTDSLRTLAQALAGDEPAETQNDAPAPADPPPEVTLTLEEVRSILGKKSRQGHTEEIRSLLQKYGADKLSGIDPKDYAALLADVEALDDAT
jgi:phenylalanyl-tRNA synthetase beta subunit